MDTENLLRAIEIRAGLNSLPIIGPQKGLILSQVLEKYRPKNVLEVGTLVGYSAILMSQYLPRDGKITSIEIDPSVAQIARKNFMMAGVERRIDLIVGDALSVLPTLDGYYDLLFLDAEKSEYLAYLKLIENRLTPNAIVIADNVKIFADQMSDYLEYVSDQQKYLSLMCDFEYDAVEVSFKHGFYLS